MNASAARKPGLEAGVSGGVEDIGEVDRVRLMFDGEMESGLVVWLWEKLGEDLSMENVDMFPDFSSFGREETDRGSGASSREKIERSSPFHRSPHV